MSSYLTCSFLLYITKEGILINLWIIWKPGPEVIKLFSCSTQLSMKFSPLINVKMPTIVGILTFIRGKNSILGISETKNSRIS